MRDAISRQGSGDDRARTRTGNGRRTKSLLNEPLNRPRLKGRAASAPFESNTERRTERRTAAHVITRPGETGRLSRRRGEGLLDASGRYSGSAANFSLDRSIVRGMENILQRLSG